MCWRIFLIAVACWMLVSVGPAAAQEDDPPIIAAAATGDVKKVEALLDENPSLVQGTRFDRKSPLQSAVEGGHRAVVELLLKRGAAVNVEPGIREKTPLEIAAHQGNLEMVELLLENGANPNSSDTIRDSSPLCEAAKAGRVKVIELLLRKGGAIDGGTRLGTTPLIAASAAGRIEAVQVLLDRGADASVRAHFEGTAIEAALRQQHFDVVKLLVSRGVDPGQFLGEPRLKPEQLKDPKAVEERIAAVSKAMQQFHVACAGGQLDRIREYLALCPHLANTGKSPYGHPFPLFLAVKSGNAEVVELLIRNGADVNRGDSIEGSPLDLAIKLRQRKLVELLVTKGAAVLNPTERHGTRTTPLCAAVSQRDKDLVQFLLEHGAAVDLASWPDVTPLQIAAGAGQVEIVKLLLDRGANINGGPRSRSSALHAAAQGGHAEVVKLLLDRGADPKARSLGATVMETAARAGHKAIVDLLVQRGATADIRTLIALGDVPRVAELLKKDPNLLKTTGRYDGTLLHLAASSRKPDMVRTVLAAGADVNARDSSGRTALHVATNASDVDVMKVLLEHKANVNARDRRGETPWDGARFDRDSEVKQLLASHGGRSGRTLGPKESLSGTFARQGRTVEVGGWQLLPEGQYSFTADKFSLTIRNVDGKAQTDYEIGPAGRSFRLRIFGDSKAGITLTEKTDGGEKTTPFNSFQEFKSAKPEMYRQVQEMRRLHDTRGIEGRWEVHGPTFEER